MTDRTSAEQVTGQVSPMNCPKCGKPPKVEVPSLWETIVYCPSCVDWENINTWGSAHYTPAGGGPKEEQLAIEAWNETVTDYICERWYAALEERKP